MPMLTFSNCFEIFSYLISISKTDNNLRTSFLLVVSSKEIPTRSSSINQIFIDSFKALTKYLLDILFVWITIVSKKLLE